MTKKNTYELVAVDTVLVDIRTERYPTAEMLIDLKDWEMLLEMGIGRVSCHRSKDHNVSYARVHLNGTTTNVHRLLLPESDMVDHLSRDGLDNRRCNIRSVDNSMNQRNVGKRSNNTSGVTGVCWDNSKQKWEARISIDGKRLRLGYFTDLDVATSIRRGAEHDYGYIS